ncbi:hypothetical protein [Kineococcus sp. SYSU DK006]|uniref:hypothetical protein n=1 Tax=Kineococcus sp. SYSU DK006 TaxID=3383127 RepID=UPI003D7D4D37
MRRIAGTLAGAAALVLLGATPAGAAAHGWPWQRPPEPGSLTITHVSPLMRYRLTEPQTPGGGQLDEGVVDVTYRCAPLTTTVDVRMSLGVQTPSVGVFQREHQQITCDGGRHTERFVLGRGTSMPFTPARTWELGTAQVQHAVDDRDPSRSTSGRHERPVLVRYVGW